MGLFLGTVTKWQVDSWKRVRNATTGTQYLLNTNRIDSVRTCTGGLSVNFYYFDNPFDYRDNGHYMVITMTLAQLITQMDTAMSHTHITLPCYQNNDPTLTIANITVPVHDLTYAVLDDNSATRSWVAGTLDGWKYMKVLVNLTPAAILALVV
jgi:hypothetical protein